MLRFLKAPLTRLIGIVLTVLLLLGGTLYFLKAPSRARKETAVAQATAKTAEGQKAAAQDTVKIVVENQATHGRIDIVTRSNENAIRSSVGADEQVGAAVHSAGIHALCLRDTYRLQPACGGLLNAGPSEPPH